MYYLPQTTCSNDISLLYPWLHISDTLLDIKVWLRRQAGAGAGATSGHTPPPPLLAGSLGRHGNLAAGHVSSMRLVQVTRATCCRVSADRALVQGTYCLVESVQAEQEITPAGEQLVIMLGFRTTNKVQSEVSPAVTIDTVTHLEYILNRFQCKK